jgi:hypothetical protein
MKKSESKRPRYEAVKHATIEERAQGIFEALAARPHFVRAAKEVAAERGVAFDVLMHEAIGMTYLIQGQPLPPELREYLMTQDPGMPAAIRDELLKPGVN